VPTTFSRLRATGMVIECGRTRSEIQGRIPGWNDEDCPGKRRGSYKDVLPGGPPPRPSRFHCAINHEG